MRSRRYGTFTGGIDLPDEKLPAAGLPIRPCSPPARLRVPLAPCGGEPARLIVPPGQRVRREERIAVADDETGVDIFAPLAGRIGAVVEAGVSGPDGFEDRPAVEMTDLEPPAPLEAVPDTFDWPAANEEALRKRIADGHLTASRGATQPLVRWINASRRKRCSLLVVNAVEGQPYVTSAHRTLVEHPGEVVAGLAILARVVGAEEAAVAVDRRRTDDYADLVDPARRHDVTLVALPHKYPVGADPILAYVLTRREPPLGGGAMDVGAAVTDAATCLAVARWTAGGRRDVGRVVTVAGDRAAGPGNVYAPFGLSCGELTGAAGGTLIHGGPMVGLRCPDGAVVSPATDAVLAIAAADPAPASPCIRCGWCTDYCPARINVSAMNDAFELGQADEARRLGAEACVGCGVCSYVCPARLPLAQRVRQLRRIAVALRRRMPLFAGD